MMVARTTSRKMYVLYPVFFNAYLVTCTNSFFFYVINHDEVLIAGFGRKGHIVGDILGVQFKLFKVSGVSLLALFKEKDMSRS